MIYFKTYGTCKTRDWAVFIHGAGGSSTIWYKQIKEFKQNFNVLLIDLRGHGKSKDTLKMAEKYSFNAVTRDIFEVLDHLNIKAAHFLGISLGTIIIRNIAELEPQRVKSMIMAGAVLRLNTRINILIKLGNLTQHILPYMLLYRLFAWCMMPGKIHRFSRALFVKQAKKLGQKEFIKWFELTGDAPALLSKFKNNKVSIPTFYVMGEADTMFLKSAKKAAKADHNVSLFIIEDCGHVSNVDQPSVFNEQSIQFLQSVTANECRQKTVKENI